MLLQRVQQLVPFQQLCRVLVHANAVDGRAHIVAHAAQQIRFGRVGPVGFQLGSFRCRLGTARMSCTMVPSKTTASSRSRQKWMDIPIRSAAFPPTVPI